MAQGVKLKKFSVILSVVLLCAAAVAFQFMPKGVEKDVKAAYLKGGEFSLSNEGEGFKLSSLKGSPVILYFGFTFCPDVCPVGLTVIRDALNSSDALSDVPVLFVTLDPERDNKQRLDEYTAFFHSNIKGLTGSLSEISSVAKQYGTYFRKSVGKGAEASDNYNVDHTAYYYLIDGEGELIRVLDHNAKAEQISDLLLKMI